MTTYADSSALVKLYLAERETETVRRLLDAEPHVATGRHSIVEVRTVLARGVAPKELAAARDGFESDLETISLVELDEATCERAASIGEALPVRALDALHLAAAERLGGGGAVTLLTYDRRQAQAARSLGFTVLGA